MKKKKKGYAAILIVGYLSVITIAACVILLLKKWIDENVRSASSDAVVQTEAGAVAAFSGENMLTMTQEELDAKLKEAAESAQLDMAAAVQAASEDARGEVLDGIRTGLETENSTFVEVLRPFYPNDIVLVTGGRFHFIPIDPAIPRNTYTEDNLRVLENGEIQYLENGEVISHKGIDVSSHQGRINWQEVAEDGVEFAMIRAVYRGYGSAGRLVEDEWFDENISGAVAAGIHVGAYVYSQAVNEAEAVEEAELVLRKLKDHGVKCPIVLDVEKTADAKGRMNQLSPEERTKVAKAFCDTVEEAGYTPMFYHNMEMAVMMIDIMAFQKYTKWFAYYNGDLYYPYEYSILQYSEKGSVKGIKGEVDLDISFIEFWEE